MAWNYTEPQRRRRPLDTPVRPAGGGGTGGPPTGPAGGDLTGTYPAPTIAAGAVGNAEISDVAYAKVTGAPTIPTTLPPSGPASGDLSGTYPAPQIAAGVIVDADVSATAAIQYSKLTGVPTALPPSGTASGSLSGTYPAPTLTTTGVAAGTYGTATKVARVTLTTEGRVSAVSEVDITATGGAPSGPAGGDLAGTYPDPTIAKLKGAAVGTTTPLARGDVLTAQGTTPTLSRLALGAGNFTLRSNGVDVIWSTNIPGGGAGGDLGGNYPNPVVGRLNGAQLGATTPLARGDVLVANSLPSLVRLALGASGTVLQSNGTDAVWGTPPGGAPSGAAGGSLAGTYPNPTLAASGATAGTYGDQYNVAKVTVNAEGRVTAVVQVLIRARWG
jgi:hypothetical protein